MTPELLAATGARYSRSNEGLDSILARVDPLNLDKSVDSIFRMIDYGHQSIADMVPVSVFIDGISMWLAYFVWSLCPTAGGQESSTRYIRMDVDGLISPSDLGIDGGFQEQWRAHMSSAFDSYFAALGIWDDAIQRDARLARIPRSLLEDTSERASKAVARMKRNYAFDRARYYLPMAASTNMMLIMSARGFVQLNQHLLSSPLPEARRLGALINEELALVAPRLVRHAEAKPSYVSGIAQEFAFAQAMARDSSISTQGIENGAREPAGYLEVYMPPEGVSELDLVSALSTHDNRYAYVGPALRRTAVRFGWHAVAMGEIRDLNRHRTGTKFCPVVPCGFYGALDQSSEDSSQNLAGLARTGTATTLLARDLLIKGDPTYVYWLLLGAQVPFEHTTTADKFVYEAELRTGTGAHYRYAGHFREVLNLWYERFPLTRELVLEGTAEPE